MISREDKMSVVWSNEGLLRVLSGGGVAVMPTDTLYGIVGSAQNTAVVNRIYVARKRNPEKPCIVLVGDISEITKLGIILTPEQKKEIESFEVPTSFILDCEHKEFEYLHRGTKTLAFRLPLNKSLQELLKKTGPLIAPSANTEAMPPSTNITQAKNYFGDSVDLYIDGGEIEGKASRVVKLHKDGSIDILRN